MLRNRYQCPFCSGREGTDLTFQQFKDHIMFSHGSKILIEFPEEIIREHNRDRVFRGTRMNFLPIINSNRIADGIANRAA